MKKFLALVVSLVMIMAIGTVAVPVNAAVESEDPTREEIVKLAQIAFPEYAEKISKIEPLKADEYRSIDPVVIEETRKVSEDTSIKYQEFESGRAFIFKITCGKANQRVEQATGHTDYTVDLSAMCTFASGSFRIDEFKHRCTVNNDDSILSRGSLWGDVVASSYGKCRIYEEGSDPAMACYLATFPVSLPDPNLNPIDSVYTANIEVVLDNGNLSISGF